MHVSLFSKNYFVESRQKILLLQFQNVGLVFFLSTANPRGKGEYWVAYLTKKSVSMTEFDGS